MKRKIATVILCAVLISCASARPTPEQLKNADYGPFPSAWREIVSKSLAEEMVRPDELYVREMRDPVQAGIMTPGREFISGWGVCGFVVTRFNKMEPFFVLVESDRAIYKVLGHDLAIRPPNQKWFSINAGRVYREICPNLFR